MCAAGVKRLRNRVWKFYQQSHLAHRLLYRYTQKRVHKSSHTSGIDNIAYTLLQQLKRICPDRPALSMLVEPLLLGGHGERQLDKQKFLKEDTDTDQQPLVSRTCGNGCERGLIIG